MGGSLGLLPRELVFSCRVAAGSLLLRGRFREHSGVGAGADLGPRTPTNLATCPGRDWADLLCMTGAWAPPAPLCFLPFYLL